MNDVSKLHPRASELLAYADKRLNKQQQQNIEALLLQDPDAVEFLKQLQASDLPFASAFEPLLQVKDNKTIQEYISRANMMNATSRWPLLWKNLPVRFAAGIVLGLALSFIYQQYNTVDRPDWLVQVAEYQQLYVRETVQVAPLDTAQIEQLEVKLGDVLGTRLRIPDLSEQDLVFMRGQILSVNHEPLVQLVYLPSEGKPVALCITPKQAAVSTPAAGSESGLSMVHWNDETNSFVLVGDYPAEQLMENAHVARIQLETVLN